ncbi:MAG: histidinol-phosphate transaminase [Gammaproteobacteria bacterium]|nr:histidinol-phosphate transaminase [Gammaproteobacteria bacterium]
MSLINLTAPGISSLTPYQPGKPMEELERELGITDIIKLASNENPFGPSPMAIAAAQRFLPEVSRYPDGNGFALRNALAEHHVVDPDCITIGNGSNEILELVARLFLVPGTQSMFSQHAFAVYPIVTQSAGAEAVVVPVQKETFQIDLYGMLTKLSDRVRVLFLANPNNPTGTWLPADELRAFIEKIPPQVVVVIDEAYFEYVDKPGYASAVDWINDFPNLLVTRTFSKVYGLAGFRIGYSVSQPEMAELLNRVRQPFNTNMLAQEAAIAALQDTQHLQSSRELNLTGMRQLEAAFTKLGLSFIPSAGNFICVNFGRDAMPIYDALLQQGVIVRPIANYDMPTWLRVTVGSELENQRFIDALGECL